MKPFQGGRKYQGGWIGAAISAAGAIAGSLQSSKDAKNAAKQSQELSAEGFRRQSWIDQQQRKWQLEDRKYKEDAVGGFRGYGMEGPTGTRTSTAGLADWNPENKPIGGGAMNFGSPPPAAATPYQPTSPVTRPPPVGLPLLQRMQNNG